MEAAAAAAIVVVVDPYSTGCLIAKEMTMRGYHIMAVWTKDFSEDMKTHIPQSCGAMTYHSQVQVTMTETLAATVGQVQAAAGGAHIAACLAGGEAGVTLADALSEALGVRTNGTGIPNRCDKKVQQELIRKTGLRSVRQAGSDTFDQEVRRFLETETYPVVLKPNESAGSDGVKLCHTYDEAKEHFEVLMNSQMVNGGEVPAVLCQEFLKGKEYVIDHVSLDGVHKTMMVWVYDKRAANGAAFVYFGCSPVPADSPEAKILIPYVRGVLDALGLVNGPSHGEVIITEDGPCLVEMNCRARGGDGNWRPLAKALNGGYSQVEASADSYLDDFQFSRLPDKPPTPFKASGDEIILVSYSSGTVKATPGYDMIKRLPSFVCLETGIKVGSKIEHTVDLFTGIGSVILMHQDETVLQKDILFIRHMEEINGLFDLEYKPDNLQRPRMDSFAEPSILLTTGMPATGAPGAAGAAPKKAHRRGWSSTTNFPLVRHMSIDRPELRMMKGLTRRVTTLDASKEAVVIVDPYSTGCVIANEFMRRGYNVIALWTLGLNEDIKRHVPLSVGGPDNFKYFKEITQEPTMEATVAAVESAAKMYMYRVVACLAGGEAGVDFADALSEALKVRTNGTEIPDKRDKKLQQELLRKSGLRSVRQAGGTEFAQVEAFLNREPFPVVLKPVASAGSDGVRLCHTIEEAKAHFELLMTSQMVNGGDCAAVLCQEFLRGKEYVVDQVSRDGVHKTMMVWVYDKRAANGSAFVYYGLLPVDCNSPEARILIPYVRRVLDAIGIKNGPSHGEVIMTEDGPCLVEMNCRANGGDGAWQSLARALTGGHTQIDVAVDSYVDSAQFLITPDKPESPFKADGQQLNLVSFSRGIVKSTPGFEIIKKLESFVYLETGVQEGTLVDYTIDLITCVGLVILMHHDKKILDADIEVIGTMEKNNTLFDYGPSSVKFRSSVNDDAMATTVRSLNRLDIY